MKLKNLYLLAIVLSIIIGLLPFFAFVAANIWALLYGCDPVISTEVDCYK